MKLLKIIIVCATFVFCWSLVNHEAFAQIPDIDGYVLVSGTNAPVPSVWVRLTSSGCSSDPSIHQSRYALTDSSGHYIFTGWTQMSKAERDQQIGQMIDTDFNGSVDSEWYPSVDACDPSDPSPGSDFACGRDPFEIKPVLPLGWSGYFDVVGEIDPTGKSCSLGSGIDYCINNGQPAAPVDTIYYHNGGGGGTVTPTLASTSTPTPVLSGSVSLNPISAISVGSTTPVGVTTTGPIATVTFTVGNITLAIVCASGGGACSGVYTDTPGISADIRGVTPGGPTTLTATCTIVGGGPCTGDSESFTITNPSAWWQVINTDVITTGSILSTIPSSCFSPTCTNSLITFGSGQSAGVAIAGNSGSVDTNSPSGKISNKPPYGWVSESDYNGISYDYGYFEKHTTCGVVHDYGSGNELASDINYFTAFGTNANGYSWIRYTGDASNPLTIGNGSTIDVGMNKVVLFVKNADVYIKNKIKVTPGRGFFMVVAGNTDGLGKGNIIVDPSVGDAPSSTPDSDLEGIYFTQKQFRTGSAGINLDTKQLYVRGSVAAFDKIVLERSLTNNTVYPAEIFGYGPEFLIAYPECLGERTTNWREEAP